ncbi:MAG: asparagine synthase (glutamine-hydrolyzing) [Oscillospiraceae bacterium]|nr:asparagine synthase (glutamine-hydrolyzing) [Oscillospiraceae bacterium]
MCGIAGAVGFAVNDNQIADVLTALKRRGPDASGSFQKNGCCLLHSRLSVIDPEGGSQPMHLQWEGENYSIVYNGELYNATELSALLLQLGHRFEGHSDTEVLLHAYAQWGDGCLEKLNGIFAFAVWEHKRRKLFLARDRMGVKPLFYTQTEGGFLFGSELKAILAFGNVKPRLDGDGVLQLIMLGPGRIPGSGILKDIKELEPGCFGCYLSGKWMRKRYWKLKDREHNETFEQTAEHVRYLVTDAIKRQMVSDVPIGTFLSGGLDSSLISSVCAGKMDAPLNTFSVDYENNDKYFVPGKFQPNADNDFIQIMREYLGSDHHATVVSAQPLFSALTDAVEARDLPGMADVDASLLLFCKEVRSYVKVALSGECADEIFGGYPWYRDPEIRTLEGFPWAQNTKQREGFLRADFRKGNAADIVMDTYRMTVDGTDVLPGTSRQERRIKEMVNLNQSWFMQTLLDRKDRMSMYWGLEVRVPFCDHRIAEYMYGVPWEFKEHGGQEKGLLRYAMADYLPKEILNRKKSPYPKTFDPLYMTLVSEKLKAILEDKDAPIHQIVDRNALKQLLTGEAPKPWYGQLMRTPQTIAFMLQLDHWLRAYQVEIEC